jgi:hypothetical protein
MAVSCRSPPAALLARVVAWSRHARCQVCPCADRGRLCLLGEWILTKRTLLPLIVSPLSVALLFLMRPTELCPAGQCQHDDQGCSANAEAHA